MAKKKVIKSKGDLFLERVYGGTRPRRLRTAETFLLSSPKPNDLPVGNRHLVPFITRTSNKGKPCNFWNPGQPPVGMSEHRWGGCMAAAFLEWMRLEEESGLANSFGSQLMFIRHSIGERPFTEVEVGFWDHLSMYLRAAASLLHGGGEEIAGMALLQGEEKREAVFNLFGKPA